MLMSIHNKYNIKITNINLVFDQIHPYEKKRNVKRQI